MVVFFKVEWKVVIKVVGKFWIKLIVFVKSVWNLFEKWIFCVVGLSVVNNLFFCNVVLFVRWLKIVDFFVFV